MRLYEYIDRRGRPVITRWMEDELDAHDSAALEARLDATRSAGEQPTGERKELPPGLFRGPVKDGKRKRFYPNTYKLTVNTGRKALRPLACKGPVDTDNEWTILVPVIEVGNKYPAGCFEEAERRREEIIANPSRRREMPKLDE